MRRARGHLRSRDDEGNVRDRLVDEEPVCLFAMFAKHLPMVAHYDNQRLARRP